MRETIDEQGHASYVAGHNGNIAFYASDVPLDGFSAIHAWHNPTTGERRYAASVPTGEYVDLGPAFYAPADPAASEQTNLPYRPVYRWTLDSRSRYSPLDLAPLGYAQHEVVFYSPCPDSDGDSLNDCDESFSGTDRSAADTDGDGMNDASEREAPGCDPLTPDSDDLDGFDLVTERRHGTSPCLWDSGAWGCVNGAYRHPGCDIDTDADGCADAWELGPEPRWGGQRDPEYRWDVFDVPGGDGNRDRMITIADISGLIRRLWANDRAGTAALNRHSDPDSPVPPPPAYHPAFDRSHFEPSRELGPPDGWITLSDLLRLAARFGFTCRESAIPRL